MKRIIKLTERQLREAENSAFQYIDGDNDTPACSGNAKIGVTGKIDNENYGIPATGDKIGNTMSVQGYSRYRRLGNVAQPGNVRESDENNDDVDDFYNHDELDTLSNGDERDNLIKVPQTAERRLELLIDSIKDLTPKQQAMVINKLVETLDVSNIPYSWAKELMHKILSRNNINK